eukprot:TRINITY_DN8526_c0_g1_i1.p2 TRINITY_DN8526_c0_g1~~TRINITY_DN8526_c0_g1_i1.p2  ORF type:complete len:178 (+),score=42.68 TRINITY_DN8526_c0_g1_i1:24-557(+)
MAKMKEYSSDEEEGSESEGEQFMSSAAPPWRRAVAFSLSGFAIAILLSAVAYWSLVKTTPDFCTGVRASGHIHGWEHGMLDCPEPWKSDVQWSPTYVKLAMNMNSPLAENVSGKDIRMSTLLAKNGLYNGEQEVKHVVLIVVVLEEVQPILDYMESLLLLRRNFKSWAQCRQETTLD